jgi:hypothetical protein
MEENTETNKFVTRNFNLEAEAERFALDFPAYADNTIFATVNKDGCDALCGNKDTLAQEQKSGMLQENIDYTIQYSSCSASQRQGYKNNYIGINKKQTETFGDIYLYIALYHEMGHVVTPTGIDPRLNEASADAFMAIKLFQHFGAAAVEPLSLWNKTRIADIFTNPNLRDNYLTTPVMDAVMNDMKNSDCYKALTPAQTANVASDYARRFHPNDSDIAATKKEFQRYSDKIINCLRQPLKHGKLPDLLSGTILSSPHALSFYIGSKFIEDYLHSENVDLLQWQNITLPAYVQKESHARITNRAEHFNLQASFKALEPYKNETNFPKQIQCHAIYQR